MKKILIYGFVPDLAELYKEFIKNNGGQSIIAYDKSDAYNVCKSGITAQIVNLDNFCSNQKDYISQLINSNVMITTLFITSGVYPHDIKGDSNIPVYVMKLDHGFKAHIQFLLGACGNGP